MTIIKIKATIKTTGETITVFSLNNGSYYDYYNMGEEKPPSAIKAGKKEFEKGELIFD